MAKGRIWFSGLAFLEAVAGAIGYFASPLHWGLALGFFIVTLITPLLHEKITRGTIDLLQPIYAFAAYYAVQMGVRPFYVHLNGHSYVDQTMLSMLTVDQAIERGVWLSSVGLVMAWWAYSMVRRTAPSGGTRWRGHAAISLGIALGVLAALGGQVLAGAVERRDFWVLELTRLGVYPTALAATAWAMTRKRVYAMAMFICLLFLGIQFASGMGGKLVPIQAILAIATAYHYGRRRIGSLHLALLAVAVAIVVAIGYFRGDVRQLMVSPTAFLLPLLGRSYGADSLATILLQVPSVREYQYGRTWLELLYWFIPRAVWAEKPRSYAWEFATEFLSHTHFAGQAFAAPSFVGDLYLNFGVLGVAFGMWALGVFLAMFYNLTVAKGGVWRIYVYAAVLPSVIQAAEGPIAVHVEFIVTRLALAWMLEVVTRVLAQDVPKGGGMSSVAGITRPTA